MSRAQVATALLVLGSVASACGAHQDGPTSRRGGDEPVTARSVAAVASEHLAQTPAEARRATDFEELGPGWVGAELRFEDTGERGAPRLAVAVGTDPVSDLTDCSDSPETCVRVDGMTLRWQEATPEEDPGGVEVVAVKGGAVVALYQYGEPVLGDPRAQELQVSVEAMLDVAADARLDATTSRAAVDAGDDLDYWRGRG